MAATARAAHPPGLTSQERRLRVCLILFAVLSAAFLISYLLQGVLSGSEFPFVVNSTAKDGVFLLLCLTATADVRRYGFAVVILIAGHVFLVLGLATMLIAGHADAVAHTFGTGIPFGLTPHTLAFVWLLLAASVAGAFSYLYVTAQRARFGLRYLWVPAFRALAATAEVLVDTDGPERPSGEEVARRVDSFLATFNSSSKALIRVSLVALAYYPLLALRPPLAAMDRAARLRFLRRRFLTEVAARRPWDLLRSARQDLIHAASQMAYLGYYEDPRAAAAVGYVPFSQRPGANTLLDSTSARRSVVSLGPRDVAGEVMRADVLIVGSGAAGATLAYELAALGREVLIIERGRHVDPSQFTEDEATQYSALYADGALEFSTDFRFAVTQGMCVGGSTVVNNAVCFDLPDSALKRWIDPGGLDCGLDQHRLLASFRHLRKWLPVTRQDGAPLNPGASKFVAGVAELGLTGHPYDYSVVDANIAGCRGCGYCNIGCAFDKKLSMLDNTLPRAQRDFPGKVRVLAECSAQRIEADGRRARAVRAVLGDGRRIEIRADAIVVSAGAVGSSVLLKRSDIGGSRVGTGLAFNMASPVTGDFDEELHSERGLQISHYLEPPEPQRFALETWFNPVVFQSLVMPGWFERHSANMARYAHMTCVGCVVGTRSNATVGPGRFGPSLKYSPAPDDFAEMVAGIKLAGRIMLAAGARRVMPLTFAYHEFTDSASLDRLDELVRDDSELWVNSAHPQGGNALSRDRDHGVVDPTFRVHGYDNLHVCDASVFPSSITVNPQLTVMALAHYAAEEIARGGRGGAGRAQNAARSTSATDSPRNASSAGGL